jgi:hypothetical protein
MAKLTEWRLSDCDGDKADTPPSLDLYLARWRAMVDAGMARAEQRELGRRQAWQEMGWAAEPYPVAPHDEARITTRPYSQIFERWHEREHRPGLISFNCWDEDYR